MDFIQGNEIVKIDPHAIDICGNNHITLGTELITLDNKKSNGGVTKVAPEYIKLGGGEGTINMPSTLENGLMRMNSQTHKIETYLNGAWTNVLTGTSSTAAITDLRFKFQDAYNTIANGIYHKDDDLDTATSYGYRNSNGVQLKRDFVPQDTAWTPGSSNLSNNNDWSQYEYYFAMNVDTYVNHTNAANAMNAELTSWASYDEWEWITNTFVANGGPTDYTFCGLRFIPYDNGLTNDTWTKPYIRSNGYDSNTQYWRFTDNTPITSTGQYTGPNGVKWVHHNAGDPGVSLNDAGHPTAYGSYNLSYFTILPTGSTYYGIHSGYTPWTGRTAIYKRPRSYRNIWRIEYPISGTTHLLYDISYVNTNNNLAFNADAAFSVNEITSYNYIDNNKIISNDPISFSNYNETIDRVNISINHNVPSSNIAGLYSVSDGLDATHHLLWSGPNNMSLSWKQLPDNTQLTTNKWGWCILSDSVIKYYSYLPSQTSINNGQSNPWDTNLIWTAVNGADSTMPIVNSVNANTSFEKTIIDHVVVVTGSSYEKANGTYRRNLTNNINNRHVYYNEHGLKLYYGALEYDGETPNNNTVTVTSYTINTWISPASGSLTTNYGASIDGTNPDSLIGYEYKITSDTHSTWNDAEAAAQNEYAHLSSFQTYGEEETIKKMADDTLGTVGSGDSVWFGMYYDGETPSANATDPAWKFIDRTRTFDEGTTNILITWEGTYPNTSSGKNVYMNDNRKLGHTGDSSNRFAIFKRPQMWVQGTGSLTEYEYLFVNVPGRSWTEHENKAQELGGHLISLHSDEEVEFLKTTLGTTTYNSFIGLRTSQPDQVWNATSNNNWFYSDGTPFDYSNWNTGMPSADTAGARYGTAALAITQAEPYMFNILSGENCVGIYKRKRNSWRIVDGKDTIYRFGEPTVTNTGSYVDSVTAFVMQPKYRNDHTDESSRTVDAQDKALTVANLTISNYGNSDYDGVYNYSNFKTDSTRKWVKNDNPNITIEYKENTEINDPSGYRWQILNSNGSFINDIVKRGPYTNDPWDIDNYSWVTNENIMQIEIPNTNNTFAHSDTAKNVVLNGQYDGAWTYIGSRQIWRGKHNDNSKRSIYETIPTGVVYEYTGNQNSNWGIASFSDIVYYHESPGIVIVPRNHPYYPPPDVNTTTTAPTGHVNIGILPGNYDVNTIYPTVISQSIAESVRWDNMYGIRWTNSNAANSVNGFKPPYYGLTYSNSEVHANSPYDAFSVEIEEEIVNNTREYYINFYKRSTIDHNNKSNVNWPWDKKEPFLINRIPLSGGINNDFIKYGYRIVFIPYLYNWSLDNYVIMGVHRLYHENGGLNIEKVVTATTNTETNLQITGQLSGAGSTTNVNIEHGITMTQGSGATDSTVSVDKTNGVNIQNTDLAITGGNIGFTNGNMTLTNGNMTLTNGAFNILDENSNTSFSIEQSYKGSSVTTSHVEGANTSSSVYTENATYGVSKVTDNDSNTIWESALKYNNDGSTGGSNAVSWGVQDLNGSNTNIYGEWIQLEYTNPSIIDTITLSTIAGQDYYNARSIIIMGSNTGSNATNVNPPEWFQLCAIIDIEQNTANQVFDIPYNNFGTQVNGPNSSKIAPYYHIINPFKYFRFIVYRSRGKYANINEIDITFSNNAVKTVMSMVNVPLLTSTSINTDQHIVGELLLTSDSRIKNDIKLVDDTKAIDLVNTLESKEYGYIDPYNKKTQKTIGFIAQEVRDVLPNAVSIQKGFIPDEIREIINPVWNANNDGTWTLTISDIIFQVNHTGKCRFYLGETKKDIQVENDKISFKFDKKYDSVYLWGKEINDFHMIDKNQIFALHHSAIQELDRKHKREVESKEEKIASLESRVESLEAFLLTVLSKQEQIITKNTELENKINEIESNSINEIESNSISEPENVISGVVLL